MNFYFIFVNDVHDDDLHFFLLVRIREDLELPFLVNKQIIEYIIR